MPDNRLFLKLCKPEIMRIGWHLAQADSRDDFVTDPVRHADFASNLTDRLNYLIEQIQNNRYRPQHLLDIDIPKSGLSVRPGNVLPIEEASLLHAVVYLLAPLLDRKLASSVYSYRLTPNWRKRAKRGESLFREVHVEFPFLKKTTIRSISPFEAWYERWPKFESDAQHACTTEGYTHLTKTDITAYFENIDLRLLEALIRSLLRREEGKTIHLLFRILEGWTRATTTGTPIGRGIPQGNDVSSFFGNIYLIPLDRNLNQFCGRREARWFRYVDDVKVFTKCERDAREAVFVINDVLRSLHLNIQGSKTEMVSGEALKEELDSSNLETVGTAFDNIKKIKMDNPGAAREVTMCLKPLRPMASRFRRKLPAGVRGLGEKDNRLFRRLMTVYGWCGRPQLRGAALAAIKELPDLRILRKALSYLTHLSYKTHGASLDALMRLIEDDQLPFPYQVAVVIESIADLHPPRPNRVASRIRKYALPRKRHWMVVQKALEAMMTFPYKQVHAKTLAEHFLKHDHPMPRRAACVFLLRSPQHHVRKRLEQLMHHPDHGVSRLALYLRRLSQEEQCGVQELARIKGSSQHDLLFVRNLPAMYAIAATEHRNLAASMYDLLDRRPKSRSPKVRWHCSQLIDLTRWSKRPAGVPSAPRTGGPDHSA